MELEKKIIKQSREKGKAFSQITLEDDYIIPDSKPDVLKVIHTRGDILFDEPKISNQALWINGRLNFFVLYRSEDEETKLESVEGSIPFQEKLSIDGLDDTDHIRLSGRLEDLGSSIINSRKLAVRAVVDILAVAENEQTREIVTGLAGEEDVETRTQEKQILDLKYSQKDVLRVRKEIELPEGKPNIEAILFSCVDVRNIESFPEEGAVLVQGEARICVIYRSEGEAPVTCFETTESFQGKTDSRLSDSSGISQIRVVPGVMEVQAREDYDGEQRILGVEMNFDIDIKVWTEERVEILEDLYSPNCTIIPQRDQTIFERLLVQNQAKVRLSDQFSLEKGQEKILQICCYAGDVTTEKTAVGENGLTVEGMLAVSVVYLTNDDFLPVAHTRVYLPMEQLVEIPAHTGMMRFDLEAGIEQLQVNLLDSETFEVKAVVTLGVTAFEEVAFANITCVQEEPLDIESFQKMPGLAGYVVREGDDLWEIAKQYHTTVERIMQTNELEDDVIRPGQKLMIVKTVEQ